MQRVGLLRFYIFGISCNLLIVVFSVLFCFCNLYLCIGVFAKQEQGVCNFLYFCIFVYVYLYMYLCICICVFVHSQNGSEACVIFCTFAFL